MTLREEDERANDGGTRTAQKDKKLPAMQFYPGDWRRDVGVQSLSFHDRGVWFEMLMLMHGSERRGVLVLNGQRMSDDMIARAIGLDIQIFNQTLTTLVSTGVASREEGTGALINRRMLRDEHVRKIRVAAGSMGGNPALLKQNRTFHDKQHETPSSSSSISVSKEKTKTLTQSVPPEQLAGALPLVDGTEFLISVKQIHEWSRAYPAVNVRGEISRMKCWFEANPTRRKTSKGIARAIVSWLSRAQDKPTIQGGFNANTAQQRSDANLAAVKRAFEFFSDSEDSLFLGGGETCIDQRLGPEALRGETQGVAN
jgi:hypothetical protein